MKIPARWKARLASVAGKSAPELSIVVVVYNMARAAARTLYSLSAAYQRHIAADDYEVIVVDNGSTPAFDPRILDDLAGNFHLIRIDQASPSPTQAVNRGLAAARGKVIGVMIDGARMVTPGLLHFARHGAAMYPRAVVGAIGWHLGSDGQGAAVRAGYDESGEDALLESIGWPQDGYRLFEIATLVGDGWFEVIGESNALFLPRKTWDLLGGIDERFVVPAGGLANADLFRRAIELPGAQAVVMLGEGTFHQLHGSPGTNPNNSQRGPNAQRRASFWAEYESIRGKPWGNPAEKFPRTYLGTLSQPALVHFVRAALDPVPARLGDREPPLGRTFDRTLWALTPPRRPEDATIAALVELIQDEFRAGRFAAAAAVARLARQRAPDEPEPQRILAQTATSLIYGQLLNERRAEIPVALGDGYRLLGDREQATKEYEAALSLNANLARAHVGLAQLRMPGPSYTNRLERMHAALLPENYVEIGVETGATLALARAPTLAIGVDPAARLKCSFKAETYLFNQTSDDFFAQRRLAALLQGRPLGLAFIDGLHLFEQALKDFMHLEAYCGPGSVILLHDTVPLNEATQTRTRQTQFYTGDVWKVVPCLKHFRPDLDIFTIAASWSGLTVVTGLDPKSSVLADRFDEAVARFGETPYSEIENNLEAALNMVPNDWPLVEQRLQAVRVRTSG